ncbi:MAG: AsnC family transcriptional regulator [Polaromonas sp.]|nr:AsnC family transcriptional regulator [Polaromonas sp.]
MNSDNGANLLLDRYDIGLLAALQANGHTTHQQLGEVIHLSASQVSRRIQRMESAGLIRAHVALLSPERLGLGVRAISYVTLTRHGGDEGAGFERDILDIPEVVECFAVTGESDYILKIFAANLSDLSESVLKPLTRLQGVANIRSNIVLQCIKSTTELPLSHLRG